jgi:hypothetical protein
MSKLRRQLEEDRALRDTARKLLRKEFDHVRRDVAPRALGERVADRVGEQLDAASDGAIAFATSRSGALAAAGGAIASAIGLWLARKPLFMRNDSQSPESAGELEDARGAELDEDQDNG